LIVEGEEKNFEILEEILIFMAPRGGLDPPTVFDQPKMVGMIIEE
jgi:hypothetical protein